jgi:hypothetical protein
MIKITSIDIVEQWLSDSAHSYVIQSDKDRDTPYVFIVNRVSAVYVYDQHVNAHSLKTKYEPVKLKFSNPEFFDILDEVFRKGTRLARVNDKAHYDWRHAYYTSLLEAD